MCLSFTFKKACENEHGDCNTANGCIYQNLFKMNMLLQLR